MEENLDKLWLELRRRAAVETDPEKIRVLQESLTNIHRHSGSSRAEVAPKRLPDKVVLEVRDF